MSEDQGQVGRAHESPAPDDAPGGQPKPAVADERRRENRPRRRISGAVWCVAVLAVVAVWVLVRVRQSAPRRAAVAAIKDLGGTVWYEEQLTNGIWNEAPPPDAWRQWLSDPEVVRVFLKKRTGDRELRGLKPHLQNLPALRDLVLMACPVTDEGLAQLQEVKQIKLLVLIKTQATRQGVSELRRALPRCTVRREDPTLWGRPRSSDSPPRGER